MSEDKAADGGGNKTPLFVVLALIGGLAIGGAAVFFLLPVFTGTPAQEPETDAVAEAAKEAKDVLRINVERFAAPMIDFENRTKGYIWLDLTFEVDGPDHQSLLSARLPRVQAAMQRALHAGPTVDPDRPGAIDLKSIEARMLSAAESAIVEPDVIHRFFITNVQRAPN